MHPDLNDKVALVTGASNPGGIGRAIAEVLAAHGMKLVVHDQARHDELEQMADALAAHLVIADISRRSDCHALVKATVEHYGRLDLLVANAAAFYQGSALQMSEDDWDQLMAVNLRGTFMCCREAARVMLDADGGSIVNISSLGGQLPVPGLAAYCASKGGIDALTRALACEWAPKIRVNAVAPGHIATPANRDFVEKSPDAQRFFTDRIPLGRPQAHHLGAPAMVGHGVAYLASDAAAYTTGQVLNIDGGLSAWQGKPQQ